MTPDSREAYVLEVNANCGLSFGENESSLGEILKLDKIDAKDFCQDLIGFALERWHRSRSTV